jgi:predicted GNAT family N-acyltransferase
MASLSEAAAAAAANSSIATQQDWHDDNHHHNNNDTPTPPPTPQEYIVPCTLEDGTTKQVRYTIRGLKDEAEVHAWAQFCASVFSYKANPPPPQYFERHYFNDPVGKHHPSLIRVAFVDTDTDDDDADDAENNQDEKIMVASCRVFLRQVSTGQGWPKKDDEDDDNNQQEVSTSSFDSSSSSFLQAGGIGEVCTDPAHRRRGLSKVLLQDAIRIMKYQQQQPPLQLSFLHAAPSFFNVYEKTGGYACATSEWSVVCCSCQINGSGVVPANNTTSFSIRKAIFPDDAPRLQLLHQHYSERRFAGCIVRSLDYWNDYLQHELSDSLWVLEKKTTTTTTTKTTVEDDDNHNMDEKEQQRDVVVAWLSLRERGGRYQLQEFGLDPQQQVTEQQVFQALLPPALSQLLLLVGNNNDNNNNNNNTEKDNYVLLLPTVVLNPMRPTSTTTTRTTTTTMMDETDNREDHKNEPVSSSGFCIDWSSEVVENELGWMYLTLDSKNDSVTTSSMSMDTVLSHAGTKHLIWPSDSF